MNLLLYAALDPAAQDPLFAEAKVDKEAPYREALEKYCAALYDACKKHPDSRRTLASVLQWAKMGHRYSDDAKHSKSPEELIVEAIQGIQDAEQNAASFRHVVSEWLPSDNYLCRYCKDPKKKTLHRQKQKRSKDEPPSWEVVCANPDDDAKPTNERCRGRQNPWEP